MDLHRLFTEHPASVGESYWAHLLRASWFAGRLLLAAGACFIHALFPFLFVKTGSQAITELYSEMVTHRRRLAPGQPLGGAQRRAKQVGSFEHPASSDLEEADLAEHGQFRVAK